MHNGLQSEDVLGVVWSYSLIPFGGLVFASNRIMGTTVPPPWSGFTSTYLGPTSHATDEQRRHALELASKIIEKKELDLLKESIEKMSYRAPGLFSRGHIIFQTSEEDIVVRIKNRQDGGVPRTLNGLIPSLVAFAADRFYDEKTGIPVSTEIAKTGKFPK